MCILSKSYIFQGHLHLVSWFTNLIKGETSRVWCERSAVDLWLTPGAQDPVQQCVPGLCWGCASITHPLEYNCTMAWWLRP